jgi:hypothetical protein
MTLINNFAHNVSMDALLGTHVSLLVATLVFVGFAQVALVDVEIDPRRDLRRFKSQVEVDQIRRRSAIVGSMCVVGVIATILLAFADSPVTHTISAALAIIEVLGILSLFIGSIRVLRHPNPSGINPDNRR